MRNVQSLQPIPNQTGVNPWQLQTLHSAPAVLGPQEAVQLATQRAREALNDQCDMAQRALLRQQEQFLTATHQYEAAARQNLVSALARSDEAHNYNVQMQVRQLEQEADARFFERQRELSSRFSQKANQALENQP